MKGRKNVPPRNHYNQENCKVNVKQYYEDNKKKITKISWLLRQRIIRRR